VLLKSFNQCNLRSSEENLKIKTFALGITQTHKVVSLLVHKSIVPRSTSWQDIINQVSDRPNAAGISSTTSTWKTTYPKRNLHSYGWSEKEEIINQINLLCTPALSLFLLDLHVGVESEYTKEEDMVTLMKS
jgi:hypothetical protein